MAGGNQVIDIALQTDPQRVNFNLQNSGGSVNFDLSNGSDMSSRFIDDTAGAGVTNKTWSANKLTEEFADKADKADTVLTTTLSRGRKANTAIGVGSIAFGNQNTASGNYSIAIGNQTTASGSNSYAEGTNTKSTANNSHSEGNGSISSGSGSHAEGNGILVGTSMQYTSATASGSHAEGIGTLASSNGSHSEGQRTTASGQNAHAEGSKTIASGSHSHAEGMVTEANHRSQHVGGEYNIPDDSSSSSSNRGNYVEIIGNGTDDNARSNARTLDWNGNENLAGDLTINKGTANEVSVSDLAEEVASKAEIDDTAGVGDSTKVWSADKSATETNSLLSAITSFSDSDFEIKQITENPSWVIGKYLDTSGATVNFQSPVSASGEEYIVISCSEGDIFKISGRGGNAARLWAFADINNNVLTPKASAGEVKDGFIVEAPIGSAYLIVNEDRSYTPKGVWRYIKKIDTTLLSQYDKIKISTGWNASGYYDLSGETVDIDTVTSESSMISIALECLPGDIFSVSGKGGNNGRLWGFADASYHIISRESAVVTATDKLLVAPDTAAYIIVNEARATEPRGLWKYAEKSILQLDEFKTETAADFGETNIKIEENKNKISALLSENYSEQIEGIPPWESGKIIDTSGTTISDSVSGPGMMCLKINCVEGDIFKVSGRGGNTARLWAFVDKNNNVLSPKADANVTNEELFIIAPANAYYLVVNVQASYTPRGVWKIRKDKYATTEYLFTNGYIPVQIQGTPPWTIGGYYNLGGVTVDVSSRTTASSMMCVITDCVPGEVFTITGRGGNAGRLWAFTDETNSDTYNILEKAYARETANGLILVAPEGAKHLIVNMDRTYTDQKVYRYIKTPSEMPHVRFLVYGNSYSCDWCSYVPFILKEMGVTCEIYHYVRDRLTLRDLYYRWESADAADTETDEPAGEYNRYLYYIDTRTMEAWQQMDRMSAKALAQQGGYDFITLQQSVHHATDPESFSPWLELDIDLISKAIDKNTPIAFVGVVTKPADDHPETNLSVLQNTVMQNYPFSFVIPYGTAVFNARTNANLAAIGDSTSHNFWCNDNIHLQDGLPRYTAALAASQAIVKNLFPQKSVLFNKIRVTYAMIYSWNVLERHLPNDPSDASSYGITDDNCLLVQQAAVLANNYPYQITTIHDLPETPI